MLKVFRFDGSANNCTSEVLTLLGQLFIDYVCSRRAGTATAMCFQVSHTLVRFADHVNTVMLIVPGQYSGRGVRKIVDPKSLNRISEEKIDQFSSIFGISKQSFMFFRVIKRSCCFSILLGRV